jgi:hypothetical protein
MDAAGFRALADRCRELTRVAVRDDVRRQLRQWSEDFEAEADAAEETREFCRAHEPVGAKRRNGAGEAQADRKPRASTEIQHILDGFRKTGMPEG